MTIQTQILGTGSYHPEKIVTNDDLAKLVDTNHEWIMERTGIAERRVCKQDGGEFPSDMAYEATLVALEQAGLSANDLDMIIFATCQGDQHLPNTACLLQQKLGIENKCASVDIGAACSGFIYGLNMANSFIQTGLQKNILVIGSEMISPFLDWNDRKTCILFGDGCGVAIVGPSTGDSQVLASHLGADGSGKDFISKVSGAAVRPVTHEVLDSGENYIKMQGQEMFKIASRTMTEEVKRVVAEAGLELSDIDWLVPHQANLRIIDMVGRMLRIPEEKVIINIEKYANTSAATVPMALDDAIRDGRVKRGDIVCLVAFGAGLTFGATLLRY